MGVKCNSALIYITYCFIPALVITLCVTHIYLATGQRSLDIRPCPETRSVTPDHSGVSSQ